jgi:hypothetical protein
MQIDKKKILILEEDFDNLVKFQKYIRIYKSEIYEDACDWAIDKNNTIYD